MKSNYYVYTLLNPLKNGNFIYGDLKFNYEPFYIGKGLNDRLNEHSQKFHLENDKNKHKVNTIKKILSESDEVIKIKLYENLTENESFIIEENLINLIGRKELKRGPLCNLTKGGEGSSGRITTDKTKEKISNTLKENGDWKGDKNPSKTIEHKNYMSTLLKNRTFSEDSIEKMRKAKLGKTLSNEHINKIVIGLTNRPCSIETRNKISNSNYGKIRTSEMKMNCSLSKIDNINGFILDIVFIKNNIIMETDHLIEKTKISRSVINRIKLGKHWSCCYTSEEFLNKLKDLKFC